MVAPSYQLVMRSGPTPGKVFPITNPEITVGRDVTNDIVINDAEISRRHARLTLQAGDYVVEDLGSTNGSFVNGQRLMGPHALHNGELVMFGENVGLVYESTNVTMDLNATVISAPMGPQATVAGPQPMPPAPPPMYAPPPPMEEPPMYAQQVPAGPFEPVPPMPVAPPKKSGGKGWIFAGCGCLLILLCIVVVIGGGLYYIDSNSLYCVSPWSSIFSLFGFCP